jgi:hypothetical protein
MKPKADVKMGIVTIGYDTYMLPLDKAYQLHALMGAAIKQNYEFVANAPWHYLIDNTETLVVGHAQEVIDLQGKTKQEVQAYWNHQKARAALIPNEEFKPQTLAEYEESKHDNDV